MDLNDILQSRVTQIVGVGVGAFAGGLGVGYILGKRQTESMVETEEQLEFDYESLGYITGVGEDEDGLFITTAPAIEMPESIAVEVEVAEDEEEYAEPEDETESEVEMDDPEDEDEAVIVPEEEENLVNIFASYKMDWDQEAEEASRTPDEPYIISYEEWAESDGELSQLTLTYYKKDDIMADEAETPIYDHPKLVGDLKFGHGSNSPSILYVRNEKRRTEYEILLDEGGYVETVHGLQHDAEMDEELQHSGPLKFRNER